MARWLSDKVAGWVAGWLGSWVAGWLEPPPPPTDRNTPITIIIKKWQEFKNDNNNEIKKKNNNRNNKNNDDILRVSRRSQFRPCNRCHHLVSFFNMSVRCTVREPHFFASALSGPLVCMGGPSHTCKGPHKPGSHRHPISF